MVKEYGPTLGISKEIHAMKYRNDGEDFRSAMIRVADTLKDNVFHYEEVKDALLHQKFPDNLWNRVPAVRHTW